MSERAEFAIQLAYEAGRYTLPFFGSTHSVTYKEDQTPVTEADKGAERLIRAAIKKQYAGEGILGEEEGESGSSDERWVVDPIDGTKSFVSGVPLFATLLSFEIGRVPHIGVCYFPALDKMIYAERNEGTYENGRRCQVSSKSDLSRTVLCSGSLTSLEKHGKLPGVLALAKRCLAARTWGDAYGHYLVASGKAEAMIDPIVNRWDVSAMQVIVEQAGGRMTSFRGESNPETEAVSSNGALHEAILRAFRT